MLPSKWELRVYSTARHLEEFGVLSVEQHYCIWPAVIRSVAWRECGCIPILVRPGMVDSLKLIRPPGWGKVQARHILVARDRATINARRRELRRSLKPTD